MFGYLLVCGRETLLAFKAAMSIIIFVGPWSHGTLVVAPMIALGDKGAAFTLLFFRKVAKEAPIPWVP